MPDWETPPQTLIVTVKARPASFKTTVALIIEDTLKKHGFIVDFDGTIPLSSNGQPFQEHSPEMLEKIRKQALDPNSDRIKAAVKRTKVVIRQEQKARRE